MGEGGREEGRDGQFTRNLPIYSSLGLKKGSFRLDELFAEKGHRFKALLSRVSQ